MKVGVNIHPFRAHSHIPISTHVAVCESLGVHLARADVYADTDMKLFSQLAEALWKVNIQLLPILIPGEDKDLALRVAREATPNMTAVELLNEVDVACILGPAYDGDRASHYDITKVRTHRDILRNLTDTFRDVLPDAKLLFGSGGWKHTALPQMMWDGSDPAGDILSAGATWDGTVLHHYAASGSITQMGRSSFNALDIAKRSFGRPIWLTEVGWDKPHNDNRTSQAAYLYAVLRQYAKLSNQYDIEAVIVYELFDSAGRQFGITQPAGPKYPAFDVVRDFARSCKERA